MKESCDVLVIGGGFFGLYLAEYLTTRFSGVVLCERENTFMSRASWANQARIHNGYHYPRSILTAFRSRVNYSRFLYEFKSTVDGSFEKYYGIGRIHSKVTAGQYRTFMERIRAPIEVAPARIRGIFNKHLIEEVFKVEETAFDAEMLRDLMIERVHRAGVETRLCTEVKSIREDGLRGVCARLADPRGEVELLCRQVFNCTYSRINSLHNPSGLPLIPLKHEMTEMALIEMPPELNGLGITVMCGPFFSLMPFPPAKMYTLSHVRYTPHFHWHDGSHRYLDAADVFRDFKRTSRFQHMIRDASRYLPALGRTLQKGSIWEVKTLLPLSEVDDSRPILFKINYGVKGYHCIMGGKIDNVYDVVQEVEKSFFNGNM